MPLRVQWNIRAPKDNEVVAEEVQHVLRTRLLPGLVGVLSSHPADPPRNPTLHSIMRRPDEETVHSLSPSAPLGLLSLFARRYTTLTGSVPSPFPNCIRHRQVRTAWG